MAKRNIATKWIILAVVAIIGLTGLTVWKSSKKPKGEAVLMEKVSKRTIKETVSASGKIYPQTEVKISSDVSGEIVELYVEEGDSVKMNQLLAKIDPDAYQSQVERGVAQVNSSKAQKANSIAQIENLKAQKEQIEAQLVNAREILRRNEELNKDGVVSAADYETSLSNVQVLEANLRGAEASIKSAQQSVKAADFQVQSAEASLKELRTSLKRTTIYAPVSGIVSLLNVEKGERVVGTIQMTGTEMMRIANLNAMEVQVEVSENDIPRVSMNDVVEIEVDAYLGRKFKGFVTQIANSAVNLASTVSLTSDQVTNFIVTVGIDPASYKDLITDTKPYPFRPGMSASVEITTEIVEDALSIPIQAVTTREEKEVEEGAVADNSDLREVVFLVTETDTVSLVEVKTGIQDDSYIQVLSGLDVDQPIVSGPYSAVSRDLSEGTQVREVDEKELYKKD